VLLAGALSGCQLLDGGAGAAEQTAGAGVFADAGLPPDAAYPDLRSVPPRPQLSYSVEQRRAIVERLISDRALARYTDQAVRYRSGLSSLPPPPAPPPPAGEDVDAVVADAAPGRPPPSPSTDEDEEGFDSGTYRTLGSEDALSDDGSLGDFVRDLVRDSAPVPVEDVAPEAGPGPGAALAPLPGVQTVAAGAAAPPVARDPGPDTTAANGNDASDRGSGGGFLDWLAGLFGGGGETRGETAADPGGGGPDAAARRGPIRLTDPAIYVGAVDDGPDSIEPTASPEDAAAAIAAVKGEPDPAEQPVGAPQPATITPAAAVPTPPGDDVAAPRPPPVSARVAREEAGTRGAAAARDAGGPAPAGGIAGDALLIAFPPGSNALPGDARQALAAVLDDARRADAAIRVVGQGKPRALALDRALEVAQTLLALGASAGELEVTADDRPPPDHARVELVP